MKKRKSILIYVTLLLSFLLVVIVASKGLFEKEAEFMFPDLEVEMNVLYENGMLLPQGEALKKKQPMMRIEFFSLANHIFGLHQGETYKYNKLPEQYWEVSSDIWYAYVLKTAQESGYVIAYEDGSIRPENNITREEAAVIIANLLGLDPNPGAAELFADSQSIRNKDAVGAVIASGYFDRITNKRTFQPQ